MTNDKDTQKVSPVLQILLIVLGIIIISYTLYRRVSTFHIEDPIIQIKPVTPQKQQEFGDFQVQVTTGLYIKEFEKFDITKNEFVFNGTIWFMTAPGSVSEKTISGFSFENAEILHKSEPSIKFVDDLIFMSYDIRVRFSSPLSFKDFPIDDHRLYLTLINKYVLPDAFKFVAQLTDFKITANTDIWGWELVDKTVEAGYSEDHLAIMENDKKTMTYPAVLFAMDYEQNNIRNSMTILLPLLLIFYLSMFSFSISGADTWKLPLTALTITVSYRFIMENLSPKVGYFMTSDYLYIVYLGLSCLIFLFNLVDTMYAHTNKVMKTLIVIILQAIVIGANVYFLSR